MNQQDTFSEFAARLVGWMRAASKTSESEFNQLALQLFALQFAQVDSYRRWCEVRKAIPGRVLTWREIPAIPTAAFKEFDLSSLPLDDRSRVFCSSRTTGAQPSRHFHHVASLAIYEESLTPWFRSHVLGENRLAVLGKGNGEQGLPFTFCGLSPSPEQAPQSSLVHMFDTVRRRVQFSDALFLGQAGSDGAWNLDLAQAVVVLNRCIESGAPVLLLGAAFSYLHLVDHLDAIGQCLRLPAGSRAMETGGYKGRSRTVAKGELHALITERLGIPAREIVSEYGMCELSSQAYDAVAGAEISRRVFQFPPWARVSIVSPESGREVEEGQVGLIRVLDLANVYSVLAVQTEDLGIKHGIGFSLLGRAAGAEMRGCSLQVQEH